MFKFRNLQINLSQMEWSTSHDVLLCREIMVIEPYSAKPRTAQRGQLWKDIADRLNCLSEHKFNVTQRAVRDRFKLLSEKFKRKMAAEKVASGINPEVSELDVLLEEILAKEETYNEEQSSDLAGNKRKEELDKENAHEIRLKAMESLKETQKRKTNCGQDERKVKRRSNGSEVVQFLKDRMGNENVLKDQELELKRQQLCREEKRQELEEGRHHDMMKMMQMQQQQTQQMQMNFVQSQQQQSQLLMALLEKISK